MGLLQTRAYLLRQTAFGDTSRIAVLLGETPGKIHVIAKGYRNPKSRYGGALEPFRRIEIVYYHRPGRELQIASSAEVLDHHGGIERDVLRYCYALAVLELTDRILPDEEPAPEVYTLVAETLPVLEITSGPRAALVFRGFQARVCAVAGFMPELEACAVCDGGLDARRLFSASAGGLVCRRCASGGEGAEPMSAEGAGLLRFLLKAAPAEVARTYEPALRPAALEVARLLEHFLAVHVERYRGLRSLETLGRALRASGGTAIHRRGKRGPTPSDRPSQDISPRGQPQDVRGKAPR